MSDMLYWLCTGPKEEDIWYNKCSGRNWIDRENIKEPHTLEVIMLLFIFIYYDFFFFGILLWNLIELWSIGFINRGSDSLGTSKLDDQVARLKV